MRTQPNTVETTKVYAKLCRMCQLMWWNYKYSEYHALFLHFNTYYKCFYDVKPLLGIPYIDFHLSQQFDKPTAPPIVFEGKLHTYLC